MIDGLLRKARLAALTGVLLGSTTAKAAPPATDSALAETLFRDGKALMAAGDYAGACPKFAESQRLDPGAGTLMALALCHEGEGKTASAWAEYVEVEAAAKRSGRADRATLARARIAELGPILSRLTVDVGDRAPGLEVKRDGAALASVVWGTAVPVDPGEHVVEATAPKRRPWRGVVVIGARGDRKTVAIPRLDDAPADAEPAASGAPASATRPASPDDPGDDSAGGARRVTGYAVGGFGIVALGVGAVFGLEAISKSNDAKSRCSLASCTDPGAVATNDQAKTDSIVADVAIGVGAVAVAVGLYLVFTSPSARGRQATSIDVTPRGVRFATTF